MSEGLKKNIFSRIMKRLFSKIKYLITDFDSTTGNIVFLCYGSRAFFNKNILDAISDDKIISGLHSEQACFLGIMFGRLVKERRITYDSEKYVGLTRRHSYNHAVEDQILFDRKGNIIFTDRSSGKTMVIKAYIVASARELISGFSPLVACSIGIHVGSNLRKVSSVEKGECVNIDTVDENIIIFKKI